MPTMISCYAYKTILYLLYHTKLQYLLWHAIPTVKEKTTSVNKHIDDRNIIGMTQASIRDRFRPCSRESSGGKIKTAMGHQRENQIKQCKDVEHLQALFSVAALLNLVISLMPMAAFVLPPDESLELERNRTRMLTCVILVML